MDTFPVPARPPHVPPADVQGGPLAVGIMRDPTFAAAIFGCLTYADATPLRAGCRGFRGAVAEHPWAIPVPLPYLRGQRNTVRTLAGLGRWRAAFPVASPACTWTTSAASPVPAWWRCARLR